MGHFFFIVFHLIAVVFGFWLLVISIPLHLIYASSRGNKKVMRKQAELLEEQVELLKKNQKEKTSDEANR